MPVVRPALGAIAPRRRHALTGRAPWPARALTRTGALPIVPAMDADDTSARLRALAARFEALAVHAQRLADENRSLRQQQEQLSGERSQLLAKNEQARTRVEAMIARLKSLEQNT